MHFQLFLIAHQTFSILRKNKFLYLALGLPFFFLWGAQQLGTWTIGDQQKVLYDMLAFNLNIAGNIIAIFLGHQLLLTLDQNYCNALDFASPISRETWVFGRFLGLSLALLALLLVQMVAWYFILLINEFEFFFQLDLKIFITHYLGWLCTGSLALFFSSFSHKTTSFFLALLCWIVGLASPLLIEASGDPESINFSKVFSQVWNLQRFNVSYKDILEFGDLFSLYLYGLGLIGIFLIATIHIFARKDI